MGKIIAVFGSPSSGKTVFSLKLAQELYFMSKGPVIYISPDTRVPSIPYIFPRSKGENLYSLGDVLDRTDIFKEDILKQTVTVKSMENFGYLGFKSGENKLSYPKPTADKLSEFFMRAKELFSYAVVDCSNEDDDSISGYSLFHADEAVRLVTPDLKSIEYFTSQSYKYDGIKENTVTLLNINENGVFLPIDEAKAHFKNIFGTLPYSRELKHQAVTGTLSEQLSDKKYRSQVFTAAGLVI